MSCAMKPMALTALSVLRASVLLKSLLPPPGQGTLQPCRCVRLPGALHVHRRLVVRLGLPEGVAEPSVPGPLDVLRTLAC